MTVLSIKGTITSRADAWVYDWLDLEYTAREDFCDALAAAEGDVTVEINSPGGYVNDAAEIYEAIRSYGGGIEVKVVGQAASCASFIACAAKSSITPMGSLFLHNCLCTCSGNHNDMREMADTLEAVDSNIMGAYREKTGLSDDEIYGLMEANTTLSAERAVELGFIDRISRNANYRSRAAQAQASYGIAAGSSDFFDARAIAPDKLAAMREAYEQARASQGGGKDMDEKETEYDDIETIDAATAEPEATADGPDEGSEEAAAAEAAPEGGDGPSEDAAAPEDAEPEDAAAAYERGVRDERARIAGIEAIAQAIPEDMVRAAKFDDPCDARELSYRAVTAHASAGAAYLEAARADAEASGSAAVAAEPADADAKGEQKQMLADALSKKFSK